MWSSVWNRDLKLIAAAAAWSKKKIVCKKLCYMLFLKLFLDLEWPLISHLHLETSRIRKRKKMSDLFLIQSLKAKLALISSLF